MAVKIIDHGTHEYNEMLRLRYNTLRKPLGLEFSNDELDKEKADILIGCFDEEKLEGCCLLTETAPKTYRLRQMTVTSGLRGKGIGRVLMQFAENLARDRGCRTLTMHARDNAIGFYEKLGYKKIGDKFIEITIPHYLMEKKL